MSACLDAEPSQLDEPGTEEETNDKSKATASRWQIRRFVARILTPIDDAEYDADLTHGGDNNEHRSQVASRCRQVAEDGLAVLERVGLPASNEVGDDDVDDAKDDAQVLYTITALADAGQPWTTDAAAAAAQRLLTDYFADDDQKKQQWIVDGILKQYLRPLFARSRPATVTESGRKAAFVDQASGIGGSKRDDDTAHVESPQAKPWKYVDLRAISVFAWAVYESPAELIRVYWPLFIPVLLALVDDPDTVVRARGLVLLQTFVAVVPDGGGLLHSTGLDSVLADAVFPTLHFLPRLTPEKESLQLLAPAYAALLCLAKAAAVEGTSKDAAQNGLPPKAAAGLLDRMLREGIYSGYFHASEHIHIVEELVRQAGRIVEVMGIYAVKHLKDLMPMYAAILTDPFAMRYKPAVAAAIDALQATLTNCWPRLANTHWQEEAIKMLMLSWLHVVEEEEQEKGKQRTGTKAEKAKAEEETANLKTRLILAADTLLAILKAASVDVRATVGPLVDQEPCLAALFQRDKTG
ncbi:hypothetical protein SEUCBS140593_001125 [Sporothrix eucalyptigena]|uniref:Uncharacterized protein n=1 Tax=Sporothrix eucalyptigena TaxID=1812306 RepID=A0ABP0AVI5_9PEZI